MNKKLMMIILFVLAAGLCVGVFIEIALPADDKAQLFDAVDYLFSQPNSDSGQDDSSGAQNGSQSRWFWGTLFAYLWADFLCILLIFLCPLLIITSPIGPLILLMRSLSIGFSAALLIECYGISGIYKILATLAPQCIIEIPVYAYLVGLSLLFTLDYSLLVIDAIKNKKIRRNILYQFIINNKRTLLQRGGKYSLQFAIGLGITIFSDLIEVSFLLAVSSP